MKCYACGLEAYPTLSQHLRECPAPKQRSAGRMVWDRPAPSKTQKKPKPQSAPMHQRRVKNTATRPGICPMCNNAIKQGKSSYCGPCLNKRRGRKKAYKPRQAKENVEKRRAVFDFGAVHPEKGIVGK